ncbi:MAG: 3-hydroxyanthranilate 3,4-dioxygenase [Pseudobdellovibrionaceae bacterium]
MQAFNFKKWIAEHRHLLKPPVGNKVVWKDREFIVMVVGGPNERTDFHVNQSEEFFYQLEGNMVLKIINADGKKQDVPLREGDIFLLPGGIPHSPQREANSVGLVIERRRRDNELDGLQWYCEKCDHKLYEEIFKLVNIETQFPEVFARYYNSSSTQCTQCGFQNGRKWTLK